MLRNAIWIGAFILSSWAGAFGIAIAVHEWRSDDKPISAIERMVPDDRACQAAIAIFEQNPKTVGAVTLMAEHCGLNDSGPTKAELDTQKCEASLEALGNAEPAPGSIVNGIQIGGGVPRQLVDAVDRYCK